MFCIKFLEYAILTKIQRCLYNYSCFLPAPFLRRIILNRNPNVNRIPLKNSPTFHPHPSWLHLYSLPPAPSRERERERDSSRGPAAIVWIKDARARIFLFPGDVFVCPDKRGTRRKKKKKKARSAAGKKECGGKRARGIARRGNWSARACDV